MTGSTTLSVYWDETFVEHNPPEGSFNIPSHELVLEDEAHPDCPERVKNIKHIIEKQLGELTSWKSVTKATPEQLQRVHDAELLHEFKEFTENGGGRLQTATFTGANEHSCEAATAASGAAIQAAAEAVDTGAETVPYALVRPSGHHAQPDQMDGYCFFNNVAVAAEHLLSTGAVDDIAIIDWDVHHGNGTQEIFYDRDDLLFISLHADHRSWGEWHPQTGLPQEKGVDDGEGYNINIPLPHGAGNDGYDYVMNRLVEPVIRDFDPGMIIVSAGQDAGVMDPLARMVLTKPGFENLGAKAQSYARRYANGQLAIVQEGGYQPSHLAFATLGVLEGALGVETGVKQDPFALYPEENLDDVVKAAHETGTVLAEHWPIQFGDQET
ncbi:class II histone deacetylase [Haloplanus rallus]|jgi:acetoin utilization deacetylase AcuC-like enzyme|uniref:Class II histone deacetylase n=1 Tax=Haloplanus rallus TaxID=1816183 RepID=A0A6B9FE59_9EURY|nr:class II histone deacetylase [Haloplanus rallus]QGX94559.1 class II histone deacetylase [Haloplanus rallus]